LSLNPISYILQYVIMKLKNQNNLKLYNQRSLVKDKDIIMRVISNLQVLRRCILENPKILLQRIYREIVPFVFIFIASHK